MRRSCFGTIFFSDGRSAFINSIFEGDYGGPVGFDWRHHGPSHWLLHPQWSRDHLLPYQAFLSFSVQIFRGYFLFFETFFFRFFMSLKISRTDVVSAVRKRFENHLTRKN